MKNCQIFKNFVALEFVHHDHVVLRYNNILISHGFVANTTILQAFAKYSQSI